MSVSNSSKGALLLLRRRSWSTLFLFRERYDPDKVTRQQQIAKYNITKRYDRPSGNRKQDIASCLISTSCGFFIELDKWI